MVFRGAASWVFFFYYFLIFSSIYSNLQYLIKALQNPSLQPCFSYLFLSRSNQSFSEYFVCCVIVCGWGQGGGIIQVMAGWQWLKRTFEHIIPSVTELITWSPLLQQTVTHTHTQRRPSQRPVCCLPGGLRCTHRVKPLENHTAACHLANHGCGFIWMHAFWQTA